MAMPDGATVNRTSLDGVCLIQLVASIAHDSFGLGYAALNLGAALQRAGAHVILASVDSGKDAFEACEEAGFPRERLILGSLIGPSKLRFAPFLTRSLLNSRLIGKHVVHLHGRWTYMSHVAAAISRRWRCPLVLSPHGQLDEYALKISPCKKALASLLYERRTLKEASCLWALSEQEKSSIRAHGFTGRIAVIPNGVNRAAVCTNQEIDEFRKKHNVPTGAKVLLFLSRIAPAKNLPLLLKAFAKSAKIVPEWTLLVAGQGQTGHIHELRSLIHDLKIDKSVRLIGPVHGKEKACAFGSASVFVLPSLTEGLPIAALEAMEYAKPILVTDVWTLPVTTSRSFGWRVPASEQEFTIALSEAMNTSKETLVEMGLNARSIVREHFDWNSVGRQARSLYASLLDDGRRAESQIR